ncbi:MAG: hypothetical protein ABL903_03940 [Methylococcales bacterium]
MVNNDGSNSGSAGALLRALDSQPLYGGQIFQLANTFSAARNEDAVFTGSDGKVIIPKLMQNSLLSHNLVLLKTNTTPLQFTVTGLSSSSYSNGAETKVIFNQGIPGTATAKGDKGDTGATGAKGDKGEKGATGAQGPIGLTGPAGTSGGASAKGEKGDKGDKGDTGAKGEKGDSGTGGSGGFSHALGDLYGGGIVVSVYKIAGVEHGLIASLADIASSAAWTNTGTIVETYYDCTLCQNHTSVYEGILIGAAAQSYSNGQANTAAIIAQPGHTTSAAKLCNDYTNNGFSGWYLPATSELNLLISQDYLVEKILEGDGNSATSGFNHKEIYWSSTELDTKNMNGSLGSKAGANTFNQYAQGGNDKNMTNRVRCVRAF